MALVDTTRGKMDESALDRDVEIIDDPVRFAARFTFRPKGSQDVVAVYERTYFAKVNPFAEPPPDGQVLTESSGSRLMRRVDDLERVIGQIDTADEFTCWVEYRERGGSEIIHRSQATTLKKGLMGAAEQGGFA